MTPKGLRKAHWFCLFYCKQTIENLVYFHETQLKNKTCTECMISNMYFRKYISKSKLKHFVVILWNLILVNMADELGEEPKDEKALELCKAALKYLHQCSGILGSMYNMPACPIFHTSHRSVFFYTYSLETFVVGEVHLYFQTQAFFSIF